MHSCLMSQAVLHEDRGTTSPSSQHHQGLAASQQDQGGTQQMLGEKEGRKGGGEAGVRI